jgi:hypothetical protein
MFRGRCGLGISRPIQVYQQAEKAKTAMGKQELRFTAKIEGKEAGMVAAIQAPVDVPEFFGTRARVPVRGTINGFPFRSSLMPYGGRHRMPVNRALRQAAGVRPGEIVDIVMERDEARRTVEAPPVLNQALAKHKAARANWEKLSFTHKKEMAASIVGAKQETTRTRRLAKVMAVLKTGTKWTG